MSNPFSLASDLLTNTIGNATSAVATNVSDSIVNGAQTAITGVQKCTYQSTFLSPIDKNKYGIVTDTFVGLDTVGCMCINEDKSSTNEKATKISNFSKNPIPGLSSDKYVCVISPNININ